MRRGNVAAPNLLLALARYVPVRGYPRLAFSCLRSLLRDDDQEITLRSILPGLLFRTDISDPESLASTMGRASVDRNMVYVRRASATLHQMAGSVHWKSPHDGSSC